MTEQECKKMLKNKLIKYRHYLDLPENITFGVEIEYENIVKDTISYLLEVEKQSNSSLKDWINKTEIGIATYNELAEEMNGEINSPILKDIPKSWLGLRNVLELLKKSEGLVTQSCGGHVNIGLHIFENKNIYWRNFFLLWILYEKEIYKFSTGEFINLRPDVNLLFERVAPYLEIENILDIKNRFYLSNQTNKLFNKHNDIYISKRIPNKKECLNNRIEFRLPNGSLSEEIWQNYINFFAKFILACRKELDVEKILYKIKNKEHNAVELADYIFDNDIDKEYFLIQTLKTNKIYQKKLPEHKIYY